jgi:FAD/FMN-containing dehydrogenase
VVQAGAAVNGIKQGLAAARGSAILRANWRNQNRRKRPMPDGTPSILEPLAAKLGPAAWSEPTERYTMDWSTKFSGTCVGVAKPSSVEEVAAVVKYCHDNDIGIVPQGGHTGLCGGATPWPNSQTIVLSLERMNRVRQIDTDGMTMTVEAGVILQNVQLAAKEAGCFFR